MGAINKVVVCQAHDVESLGTFLENTQDITGHRRASRNLAQPCVTVHEFVQDIA